MIEGKYWDKWSKNNTLNKVCDIVKSVHFFKRNQKENKSKSENVMMGKCKVCSNSIFLSSTSFLDSNSHLLLFKRIKAAHPYKSSWPNKEYKSNHKPRAKVRGLFIEIPEMRVRKVTMDVEHWDNQTVKHIKLTESEEEIDKEPVGGSSSDVSKRSETTG